MLHNTHNWAVLLIFPLTPDQPNSDVAAEVEGSQDTAN